LGQHAELGEWCVLPWSTGYPHLELFRRVYRQLQVAALRC